MKRKRFDLSSELEGLDKFIETVEVFAIIPITEAIIGYKTGGSETKYVDIYYTEMRDKNA